MGARKSFLPWVETERRSQSPLPGEGRRRLLMELLSSCSRLHSNHLFCDCHLAWLSQWLRQRPTIGLFTQCSGPASLRGLNVAEVQKSEFSCSGGCHVHGLHLPSPPVLTAASFCPSLLCDEHLHPLTEIYSPPALGHPHSAHPLWPVSLSLPACLFLSALTISLVCVFSFSPPLLPPAHLTPSILPLCPLLSQSLLPRLPLHAFPCSLCHPLSPLLPLSPFPVPLLSSVASPQPHW